MGKNMKFICLGLIGALLGNGIVYSFSSLFSNKFGTLADWVSGLGTITAIFFVYCQIEEQRKEFNFTNKIECEISITQQVNVEENSGMTVGGTDTDLYIWAVNSGSKTASFQFLGFCSKENFENIYNENVIYNPYYASNLLGFVPHSTNDFELLQPGQVSEEKIFTVEGIKKNLNDPKEFYVLYIDAYKNIYKRLVKAHK